ncbi:unnamed protein product [Ectocarpus sp. CCAP 1310/34]|nr:unnamed protein product [Ectocarpus sp. CCAP 1310/34]
MSSRGCAMLSTAAETSTPEPCLVDDHSSGPTQDAHRSFIDLFEDGAPPPATSAATSAATPVVQTTATVPGDSRSQGGGRESTATDAASKSFQGAAASVRQGLLGRNTPFRTPYGMKPLVYSDWTATGRAVASIETYLADQVVPLFGNTHTTTSITGAQTSCFRHEARQIIAQAVNAKVTGRAAEDVVLFTGTGATSAVAKLVSALGLAAPFPPGWNPDDRPVIFVGPLEHHSNLLPWRESCGEVVTVRENRSSGGVDLAHLEDQLRRFASRRLKIGAFSAASNVTGLLEDVDKVTATLHRAGALALWDYATAAPYVHVDMNPSASGLEDDQALVAKDAIFFSGHKFVGGPGTPGVLVVKKRLLCNAVPGTVGGGTVFFVTEKDHRYLSNKEEREEGGTPDILGSIRLGLAVQMKESMGRRELQARIYRALAELGLSTLRAHKGIVVLGDSGKKRLPIFSFLVRTASSSGRFLHYNFVCALLNDLFGVQSRGGCQCAGPYSQLLLGLSLPDTRAVEAELLRKHELLRPGFSRLSLSYVNSDREAKYILDAVLFVADHGASFLPYYRVNYKTGEWKHKTRFTRFPERRWLGNCDYGFAPRRGAVSNGSRVAATPAVTPKTPSAAATEEDEEMEAGVAREGEAKMEKEMKGIFEDAERHLNEAEARVGEERWQGSDDVLGPEGEALRWFLYPWEGGSGGVPSSPGDVAMPKSGGCIVKPKVYSGVAADAAAGATVSGASLQEDGGCSGDAVGTAASPVAARVGPENGRKAAAQSDPVFVKAEAAAEIGTGVVPPPPHEGGTSGSGDGDEAAAAVGAVEPVPPRPSPPGGNGEEQHAEDESAATVAAAASAAAASAAGKDNDDAASPRTDVGGDINPAKHRNRHPDDSHKYPLRQANRDSGGGQTGGTSLAAETPAFLAFSPAANGIGSAAVAGGTGDGGGENGSVPHDANGEGVGGGKLKGYEGHMSALGKLGGRSAESRLFPTPGKKIMRAVGQAVQVGDYFDARRTRVSDNASLRRPYERVWVACYP